MADEIDAVSHETETSGLSMVDVLEEQSRLEEDANAVLGDGDDKNCTYSLGYVPRQALYVCSTCSQSKKGPTGICLACSYECHDGHEIIELYTKRNFRCDCGNSKFPDLKCKLQPNKDSVNINNKYGQNFEALYCSCHRPYPDPEDEYDDDMIQCIICEDWYHGRHLGGDVPDNDCYDEMVCECCMAIYDFLWAYTVVSKEQIPAPESTASPKKGKSKRSASVEKTPPRKESCPETSHSAQDQVEKSTGATSEPKVETSTDNGTECGSPKVGDSSECLYQQLCQRKIDKRDGAVFWSAGWRSKLCTCASCKEMYKEQRVPFLLNKFDTITAYEERGKAKQPSSQYEEGLRALGGMDRVQQVEVLHGFNHMKTELTEYLRKFADNKKVVREEDIRDFFSKLSGRKRQKTSGMQYYCK